MTSTRGAPRSDKPVGGGRRLEKGAPGPSNLWDADIAAVYDVSSPVPPDAMLDVLADLAGGGPALELAVGTGRVALPLRDRGVPVHGIELSPHMAAQLHAKPGAERVPVTIGDMT